MSAILQTPRLLLRRLAPADLSAAEVFFTSERARWVGGPLTAGRAWRGFAAMLGAWEINGFGNFAVTRRGDDRILGFAGPWFPGDWPEREIGWVIFDAADEGQSIAYEAARATLDHAFGTLGWATAVSYIDPANARSRALAERLGARIDPLAAAPHPENPPLVYRHPPPEGPAHE
jgi:RimJ/RimL family protein N-acetyltransferase